MKLIATALAVTFGVTAFAAPDPNLCRHTTRDLETNAVVTFSNLHLIRPTTEETDFFAEDRFNPNFIYNFRVCENVVQECGKLGDTPFCQRNTNGDAWSLGSLSSQVILDYPSGDKARGVMIEYSNGTTCNNGKQRRIIMTLECDPNSIGPISAISTGNHQNEDPCEYELYAKSQYACPEKADNVCEGLKGCGECVSVVGCGWCSSTQQCVYGDQLRPLDGTYCLGTSSWHFGNGSCVDCNGINSCSECNRFPDCKWCVESKGVCTPFFEKECEISYCKCPPCNKGYFCPPEGGSCKQVPNSAGLFVGGMFLGFGIVAIGIGGYIFYTRKGANYEGLN